MTMAERLAKAAKNPNSGDNTPEGNTIPQVESVNSETVTGKAKSGTV